jgi:phosphatidylethanolamine/phosphatidyl-N-methylethanolamine N-methyltransferase
MKRFWQDHLTFFSQFRSRFETTGAIAPSSRFLAAAMTGPLKKRSGARRVLEVGPGTGAVTHKIVRLLQPEDRFDLVEINELFAGGLKQRFEDDPAYRIHAGISAVHTCPLQEFESPELYDVIISGLPHSNFSPELVREMFESYFRLLAPGGTLSYFEYMYVRSIRKRIGKKAERIRMRKLDEAVAPFLDTHQFKKSWVFVNLPPAWVQHLRKPQATASAD